MVQILIAIETILAILIIVSVVFVTFYRLASDHPDGIEPVENHGDYAIEHYPLTGVYFPKFKSKYLDFDFEEDDFVPLVAEVKSIYHVTYPIDNIEEADKVIALHKEQRKKNGVVIMQRS